MKYVVEKGSISINGVSLTIAKIYSDGFENSAIPKTLKTTNLINLKKELKNKKVICGVSGGIDSTVSAFLIQKSFVTNELHSSEPNTTIFLAI